MRPFTKTILSLTILITLVFSLYLFTDWFSKTTGYVLGEDEKISLAQCLTQKNSILYISTTCVACNEQLDLFGEEASTFLTTKTCNTPEECPKGVPSWTINSKAYPGKLTLTQLIELSNCDIKN